MRDIYALADEAVEAKRTNCSLCSGLSWFESACAVRISSYLPMLERLRVLPAKNKVCSDERIHPFFAMIRMSSMMSMCARSQY